MPALPLLAVMAVPLVFAAVMNGRRRRGKVTPVTQPPPSTVRKGGPIIASLPPASSGRPGDPREEIIMMAVRAGLNEKPMLVEVVSRGEVGTPQEGLELRIPVMNDALKIEGVRVNTTYPSAQKIADMLAPPGEPPFTMLTPWVAGLIYEQADAPLAPTTSQELRIKNATADTSQMIEASAVVDRKLIAALQGKTLVGPPLVGNPGKDWVVTIRNTEPGVHPRSGVPRSEAAANHGLYLAPWQPIQERGLAHRMSHVDYSQALRYMGGNVVLVLPDGSDLLFPTGEALMDPVLGPLLTGPKGMIKGKQVGEGTLPYARHPALEPAVVA